MVGPRRARTRPPELSRGPVNVIVRAGRRSADQSLPQLPGGSLCTSARAEHGRDDDAANDDGGDDS
eukprot:10115288-Alexandrium_andersonii.AAC.1